jgi:carbohydrate-selective porin OprB
MRHGAGGQLRIAVAPSLLIQPELEYFIRPGGTSAVRNAFLVGLKVLADF